MSKKNNDDHNRWRSKTIAFRVSPEENDQLNAMVRMSGLTKQEYLTANMLKHEIRVMGTPRVFKGLKTEIIALTEELKRISDGSDVNDELAELVGLALELCKELSEKKNG